jgi:hypothetical protein
MAEHHPLFSPSSAHRWLHCTASAMLLQQAHVQGEAEEETSYYAAEGTLAHLDFAAALMGNMRVQPGRVNQHGHDILWTPDHALDVDVAVGWVRELGTGHMLVEQALAMPVAWGSTTESLFGTADVLLQAMKRQHVLHVADLKFGRGQRVFAKDNPQLMLYGAMADDHLGFLFEGITMVQLHILQPRLDHWDSWMVSVRALREWVRDTVKPAIESAYTEPRYAPSDEACRWCPAVPSCKAARDKVLELFDALPVEPQPEQEYEGIGLMDEGQLGSFIEKLGLLEIVANAARREALERLLQGKAIPGWKCVEGRTQRRWGAKEEEVVNTLMGMNIEPWKRTVISPSQAQKAVGRKAFEGSAAEQLVVKPEGRPTLAPESDKRPAFNPEGTDHFDNEDE